MTAWDPPQASSTDDDATVAGALTVDPFNSLAPHYGMLLGVSDFQVIGANPRGRMRLHQAWQHGPGVVWGFGVTVTDDRSSLMVAPGLAVDSLGREVPVSAAMCLDLKTWFEEQHDAHRFTPPEDANSWTFGARLWLEHDACPTRRVPSVRSSCSSSEDSVQYSRVVEFGRLTLEPYLPAPERCVPDETDQADDTRADERDASFPALRALVRDGRVPDLPRKPKGWLDAFRSVAASETARYVGETGGSAGQLFPPSDSPRLLLADLPHIVLTKGVPTWTVVAEPIDLSVRRTHLSTWLIEELLAESLGGARGATPAPDAGGPRVSRVALSAGRIVVELTADVLDATVAGALEIRSINREDAHPHWSEPLEIRPRTTRARADRPARIVVPMPATDSTSVWYRVMLRGTGPTPLIGLNGLVPVPLAGRADGPPSTSDDGLDVVAMIRSGGDQ